MAWPQQSRRRTQLPPNWPTLRAAVLHRDNNTCRIHGPRCTRIATHVDHIQPDGPHEMSNLRAACQTCHMARTAQQAHATRPARTRPTEPHPGLR